MFDFLFSLGSFHHIPGKKQAIEEFLRVLSPQGKAVVIEFSPAGIEKIKQRRPNHPDAVDVLDHNSYTLAYHASNPYSI